MDIKLFFVALLVVAFFWLISMPRRKRRRADAPERSKRKTHNSRMVSYRGFDSSITPEGHRRIHAKERMGAKDCSNECPYCAAGAAYQGEQLRVFDDRLIRGRRDRRQMREERGGSRRDRPWREDED